MMSDRDAASETGDLTDTDEGGPQTTLLPVWLRLQGAGIIAQDSAVVDLTLTTLDTTGQELCTETLESLQPIALADTAPEVQAYADPDIPMLTWFEFMVPTTDSSCSGRPDTLRLGIGPWDQRLLPQATANELPFASLNGLYAVDQGNQLLLYGATGTTEQFGEQAGTQDEAPLVDGTYQLIPLFLLPIQQL